MKDGRKGPPGPIPKPKPRNKGPIEERGKIEPEGKLAVSGEEFLEALSKFGETLGKIAFQTDRMALEMQNAQDVMKEFAVVAREFIEAHPEIVEVDEEDTTAGLIPYPECAQLPECPNQDCHYYDPDFDPDSPENCTRKLDEAPAAEDPPPSAGGKGD